ncbi:MAG: hypothetical protein AB7J28_10770 [Hyphomonadaceae bacterium]
MSLQRFFRGLIVPACMAFATPAAAQDLPQRASAAAELEAGGDEVLNLEELDELAGGDGVHINVLTAQTLTAVNNGNSVNGQTVGSGDVSIGQDAYSGFDGIGNFIINTGHNNNLQSSMSVNIVLAP